MRIAIPVGTGGTIAEDFSSAGLFAIYDVHDETRAVAYVGRQSLEQPGCGQTPGFLRRHGVEVIMAHGVSVNAVNHLLEAGIVAIRDVKLLPPDALIAHLVSGTLQATPPDAAMHGGGCSPGGCGHCCGGQGQAHSHGGCGEQLDHHAEASDAAAHPSA